MSSANNEYVQYGCGWSAPDSWRNFDSSPTLRFERIPLIGRLYTKNKLAFPKNVEYGDIVRGLPLPDESCKAIYCSHILEHLSLVEFKTALRNTHRKLKKEGVFRLVLPDLEYYITNYINDKSADAAPTFMRETSLGQENRNRSLHGFLISWLGNSKHLWMWDYKSIEYELSEIGYREIRRAQIGDAADPKFKDVEDRERWDNCLGVECIR